MATVFLGSDAARLLGFRTGFFFFDVIHCPHQAVSDAASATA